MLAGDLDVFEGALGRELNEGDVGDDLVDLGVGLGLHYLN